MKLIIILIIKIDPQAEKKPHSPKGRQGYLGESEKRLGEFWGGGARKRDFVNRSRRPYLLTAARATQAAARNAAAIIVMQAPVGTESRNDAK